MQDTVISPLSDRDLPLLQEIAYAEDSAEMFARVRHGRWPVFLDSGRPADVQGRYDIISADPYASLTAREGLTLWRRGQTSWSVTEDPLDTLRRVMGKLEPYSGPIDLPFIGGAIGYFSYDLARRFEHIPATAPRRDDMPEMAVGLYDWALVVDHVECRSWLVGQGRDEATQTNWHSLVARFNRPYSEPEHHEFSLLDNVIADLDPEAYAGCFRRIQEYIQEGDCYQVNLARCFSASVQGDAWRLYQDLRRANPAPYGAFIKHGDVHALSMSPERFLSLRNGMVETRPIKGTRPRSKNASKDEAYRDELRTSSKDRAENLMIVDLLRNDLGRSCIPGSIRVPELFRVESFARVHHLVSTVQGRLKPDEDAMSLLRNCFPGGSITGAPKIRAMEIIEELEAGRRGLYCGAIGYIGFDGAMDTNIAIRTAQIVGNTLRFCVGGGIVADSSCAAELQETQDKAAAVLERLQTYV